jgi:hypothetical protein
MEILKKGKLDNEYLYFICSNKDCGTEFKVKRNDSAVEFNSNENKYFCTCPDCERWVAGMNRKDYLVKKNIL